MMTLILYVILLLIVITRALGDAYKDSKKTKNHYLEVGNVMLFFSLIYLLKFIDFNYIGLILLYISIRIYAFNYTYNAYRGLPGFFRGSTDDIFDKWAGKLSTAKYSTLLMIAFFFSIVITFIFG
jgi:hypothetical protein